jgi:hypothetical protein
MGRYARAGEQDAFGNGDRNPFFACLTAKYLVSILDCRGVNKRNGGLSTFIDVEVRQILLDPVEARDREGKQKAAVGDPRCWGLDHSKDAAWNDLQRFLAVAHDMDLRDMMARDKATAEERARTGKLGEVEELAEWTVSPEQPLRGCQLVVHTYNKPTKGRGSDFTIHRWYRPENKALWQAASDKTHSDD